MSKEITTTFADKPWRVIGSWQAFDKTYLELKNGAINYGFDTKELAMNYLGTLEHIAEGNEWIHNRKDGTLSVTFSEWSNLKSFVGHYQVAQCIIN